MRPRLRPGFTVIEIALVVTILGVLAAIAIPNYRGSVHRARVSGAIGDIHAVRLSAHLYFIDHQVYPSSLSDIGMGDLTDPWGNAYAYMAVAGADTHDLRKDRLGVPINSDFDLYSRGPDGRSDPLLTATVSKDDIVRALDGGYVGIPTDSLVAPRPDSRGRGLRGVRPSG